jgi:hypothetical protein
MSHRVRHKATSGLRALMNERVSLKAMSEFAMMEISDSKELISSKKSE